MDRYRAFFDIVDRNNLKIKLMDDDGILYKETLTIGQDFDIVLIRALDKILGKNKIERLSLKSVEISGKIESNALSGMILGSVVKALKV